MVTEFCLERDQLTILRENSKLQNYLATYFSPRMSVKVTPTQMVLYIGSISGAYEVTLNITDATTRNTDCSYFSVDSSKWMNAIEKYSLADKITFHLSKNNLTIGEAGSKDTISLGTLNLGEESQEVSCLENFIDNNIPSEGLAFNLSDDFVKDSEFAASLFSQQGSNNSIGISKDTIIYSDRATVLMIHLNEGPGENLTSKYIPVHKNVVNLFPLLGPETTLMTDPDFSRFYFEGNHIRGLLASEERKIEIPEEDEIKEIYPNPEDPSSGEFSVALGVLRSSLDFFKGFYEGSQWKPITFKVDANKEVDLNYKNLTSDITKCLPVESEGNLDCSFNLSADLLEKITNKALAKLGPTAIAKIGYDEDSLGVIFNIFDEEDNLKYEVIMAKLDMDL